MASKRKTREWPSQGRLELSWDAENRQQWVFFFLTIIFILAVPGPGFNMWDLVP